MATQLKEKVNFLEESLNRFIINTDKIRVDMARDSRKLKEEMTEFKEENRLARERSEKEMTEFKEENRLARERSEKEMTEFKEEMQKFREEMQEGREAADKRMTKYQEEGKAYRKAAKEEQKEMNKQWGHLANKLGTFAEDIAAPNVPRIVNEVFKAGPILRFATRSDVRHPQRKDQIYEFDAIAVTEDYVFLMECKYSVREEYIKKIPATIQNFRECFREYATKELITFFASMNIPENTVKKLTKMGVYAMAMGDFTMDLLNFEAIQEQKKKRK